MTKRYRRVGLNAMTSSERTEAANVARKIAHHPPADVAAYLTERIGVQLSADDARALLGARPQ